MPEISSGMEEQSYIVKEGVIGERNFFDVQEEEGRE